MSICKDFHDDVLELPVIHGHVEGIHQRFKRFKLRTLDAQAADVAPVIGNAHGTGTLRTAQLDQKQQAAVPNVSGELSPCDQNETLHAMVAGNLHYGTPSAETRPRGKHSGCCQSLNFSRKHESGPSMSEGVGSDVIPQYAPTCSSPVAHHPAGSHQVRNLSRSGSAHGNRDEHYFPGVPAPPKCLALALPDVAISSCPAAPHQHGLASQAAGAPNQPDKRTQEYSACSSSCLGDRRIPRPADVVPSAASWQQQHDLCVRNRQSQQHMYASSHMSVHRTFNDAGLPDGQGREARPEDSLHPTSQNHRTAGVAGPFWPHQVVNNGDHQGGVTQQRQPAVKPKIQSTSSFAASWSSQRQSNPITTISPQDTVILGGRTAAGVHERRPAAGTTILFPNPDEFRTLPTHISAQKPPLATQLCGQYVGPVHHDYQNSRSGAAGIQESHAYSSTVPAMPSSFATAVRMNGGSIGTPAASVRQDFRMGDLSVHHETHQRSETLHRTSTVPDPSLFATQMNLPVAVHRQQLECTPNVPQRWPVPSSIRQHIDASHRRVSDTWRLKQKLQQLVQQALGEGDHSKLVELSRLNNAAMACEKAREEMKWLDSNAAKRLSHRSAQLSCRHSPQELADLANMESQLRTLVVDSEQRLSGSIKRGLSQSSAAGMHVPGALQRGLPSTSISHEVLLRSLNATLERPPHVRLNAGPSSFSLQSDLWVAATDDSTQHEIRNQPRLNPSHVYRNSSWQPSSAALMQLWSNFKPRGGAGRFTGNVSSTTSSHGDVRVAQPMVQTMEPDQAREQGASMHMSLKCRLDANQAGTWRHVASGTSGPPDVTTGTIPSGLPFTPARGQTVVTTPVETDRRRFSVSQPLSLVPEVQGVRRAGIGAGEAVHERRTTRMAGAAAIVHSPVHSQADGAVSMHATKPECATSASAHDREGTDLRCQLAQDEATCSDVATQPLVVNSYSAAMDSRPIEHPTEQQNPAKLDHPARATGRFAAAERARQVQSAIDKDVRALAVQCDPGYSARRVCMSEPHSASGEGACDQCAVEHSAAERSPAQTRGVESCAAQNSVAHRIAVKRCAGEEIAVMQSAVEKSGTEQFVAERSAVQEPAGSTGKKPRETSTTHEPAEAVAADAPLQKCDGRPLCDGATGQKQDMLVDAVQNSAEQGNGEACTTRASSGHHAMLDPANKTEEVGAQVDQAAAKRSVPAVDAAAPMLCGCAAGVGTDERGDEAVHFKRYRLQQLAVLPVKRPRRSSRSGLAPTDGVKGPPRMGGFAKRLRSGILSTSTRSPLQRACRKSQRSHICEQADRCLAMEIELAQHIGAVDGHKQDVPADGGFLQCDPPWTPRTTKCNTCDDSASDATDLAEMSMRASNRD